MTTLNRAFLARMSQDDIWRVICLTFARDKDLYVPMPPVNIHKNQKQVATYHRGWRRFFWDHLWPAKRKWTSNNGDEIIEQDFKITVAARMKPFKQVRAAR